ncbi:MAG: Mrp/NBP35 family ATP-binding protein [Clostridia bacterium]|nr:Mrp/NBP35 family ATP-binding protein [Clostridia bacterium]
MTDCNGKCDSCETKCGKEDFIAKQNAYSDIKDVIAIISGKGGVGKSLVTGLLACSAKRQNKDIGIIDADITGPSIPKIFGVYDKANSDGELIYPVETNNGVKIMSMNILLEDEHAPVIWRGPIIAGAVKQFWTDVKWGNVDTMFVDCPPGTGDVPLTIFQSFPIRGIVVVTSPQDLVSDIVAKGVNMAKELDIPVLGVIQNLSYYVCDKCGEKHYIFGDSNIKKIASEFDIKNVFELPIIPDVAKLCDQGKIDEISIDGFDEFYKNCIMKK